MDNTQWIDLDKIMRLLYYNREGIAWYDVYTKLSMDENYAKSLFEIAKADGFMKVANMGTNFNIPDPQIVRLTDSGISYFARTNYETEHETRIKAQQNLVINNTTINNSKGVNVNNNNSTNHSNFPHPKENWSKNPWLVGIGTTIIVAIIFYIIKYLLNVELN